MKDPNKFKTGYSQKQSIHDQGGTNPELAPDQQGVLGDSAWQRQGEQRIEQELASETTALCI